MNWLHVLEMGVKFENEETDNQLTRGPHRKAINGPKAASQSTDKKNVKGTSSAQENTTTPKNSSNKFKEMSKHIYGKLERKKRKYKKKQIEYIGWYYDDVDDDKIRELIQVISLLPNTKENEDFYGCLFRTAYLQTDESVFDESRYETVQKYVAPVLLGKSKPMLMNFTVKCLMLFELFYKISYEAFFDTLCSNIQDLQSVKEYNLTKTLPKWSYFDNSLKDRLIKADVKSMMVVDSLTRSPVTRTNTENVPNIVEDFWLSPESLFLSKEPFPKNLNKASADQDVDMKPEEASGSDEESKIESKTKQKTRASPAVLRNEAEVNFRQWNINLRDKLNLNKYTKSLHIGPSSLKHRMNEHKETFLPKSYTPFKFSSQQMYKFIKPEEPEKIMKEINLDQSFELDYVELLTQYEFPAVLRLKKKFMTWFCKYMHEKIQKKKRDIEEKKLQKEEEDRIKRMKEEEEAENKARKDDPRARQIVPKPKLEVTAVHNIDSLDPIEDNPSKVLQCAFCLRKGQRKLSGRLIPFRANQFIHVNCALWTDSVADDKEGHILNFYFSYKKARITKCTLCNELGASVTCERNK